MESGFGIQLLLSIIGVAPAIFFHLQERGFLISSVLSSLTSGWTVTLLLVFHSGLPWGFAVAGGVSWVPPFFLVAAGVGGAVRLIKRTLSSRREALSNQVQHDDAGGNGTT